jgi:adhesin transport system membrane fusion protein
MATPFPLARPGPAGRVPLVPAGRDDHAFVDRATAAALTRPHPRASLLLFTVVLAVAALIAWAGWATLDEVTRGQGKVVPSRQVQVVQNLEGGIVTELLVREGEVVEASQVLLRLDNVTAAADYREKRARYLALSASVARLDAEIAGGTPDFPTEVARERPSLVANETQLFESRADALAREIGILERQQEQRQREIEELQARAAQLERSLALAQEELDITRPLAQRQIVSRIELLRLERTVGDLDGELQQTRIAIPRAESALGEAEQRIAERRVAARAEALRERSAVMAELGALGEEVGAGEDRVRRAEVRSPVRGTVKQLMVHTVGGVIQPGMDLIEIVPLEDTLLVEAEIRPGDIAFLYPGLPATVKVAAYDFAIYGGLDGTVETISADTIEDPERDESFYRVLVRTDDNVLVGPNGAPLPIIPGMTVQVDILTGEKTVLDYLLKPLRRAQERALRER